MKSIYISEMEEYVRFPSDEQVRLEAKLLSDLHDMYNSNAVKADDELRFNLETALLYGRVFVKDYLESMSKK